MSTLVNTLRLSHGFSFCFFSEANRLDLHWWCHFLPLYNSVLLIKSSPWLDNPWHLSTDACNTGVGRYFNREFFHMPFLGPILHHFGNNINVLELLTIMAMLKLWGPALHGQLFIICCDNNNSVLTLKSGCWKTLGMQRDLVFVGTTQFGAHRYPHPWTWQPPGRPPQLLALVSLSKGPLSTTDCSHSHDPLTFPVWCFDFEIVF